MKRIKIISKTLVLIVGLLLLTKCDSTTEPSNSNAPADHTVNKNGVMHKSGLTNPSSNCVSCHGSDLKGGSAGVSCYSCHGQKW